MTMKLEKRQLLFIGALASLCGFIVLYALSMDRGPKDGQLQRPGVPELEGEPKEYGSKLEAVDAIREERERPKPGLYGEGPVGPTGTHDPLWQERERRRIVDSIYREGRIDYGKGSYRRPKREAGVDTKAGTPAPAPSPEPIDFSKAHTAFFGSDPIRRDSVHPPVAILAMVNGEQRVRAGDRLELRLGEDVELGGRVFPRNTLLYGLVSLGPNRVYVSIDQIGRHPVGWKAHDLLDGREGIYVEHGYREEAAREVLDDAVRDINLPGMPQLGGIKRVFQRSNRMVRATIHDGYRLILKP
nr:conjugative transposon protein TraM [Allomuricauda sp.]|tara:strand:+ start:3666 stop:4565 length:900 start_codon:yes stop_codon:yes gene_type:complete